jgi:putative acetyltransferase
VGLKQPGTELQISRRPRSVGGRGRDGNGRCGLNARDRASASPDAEQQCQGDTPIGPPQRSGDPGDRSQTLQGKGTDHGHRPAVLHHPHGHQPPRQRQSVRAWPAALAFPVHPLRPLIATDGPQLVEVYRDAVLSQAPGRYSPEQIQAWANHAGTDPGFQAALRRGHGLVSHARDTPEHIEAFALLDPLDRLSLLYCRGRSSRQGRGRALVEAVEELARASGCSQLRTEASQLSRPLLERLGWGVEAEEEVLFAGLVFRRWRMIRFLNGSERPDGRSPAAPVP